MGRLPRRLTQKFPLNSEPVMAGARGEEKARAGALRHGLSGPAARPARESRPRACPAQPRPAPLAPSTPHWAPSPARNGGADRGLEPCGVRLQLVSPTFPLLREAFKDWKEPVLSPPRIRLRSCPRGPSSLDPVPRGEIQALRGGERSPRRIGGGRGDSASAL